MNTKQFQPTGAVLEFIEGLNNSPITYFKKANKKLHPIRDSNSIP